MRSWDRMFDRAGGRHRPDLAPADKSNAPAEAASGEPPAAEDPAPPLLPTFLAIVTVSAAVFFSIAAAMCVVVAFAELFRAEDVVQSRPGALAHGPWHERHCMFVVFSLLAVALGVWSFNLLKRVVRTFGPEALHRPVRGRMGSTPPRPWECN